MKLVSNDELYHFNPYHDKKGRFAQARYSQRVNSIKTNSFLNRRKTQSYLNDITKTNAALEYRREKLKAEHNKLKRKKDSISKDKKMENNKLARSQNSAAIKDTAKMRDKILKKAQKLGMDVQVSKNKNKWANRMYISAYTEPANRGKEFIKYILSAGVGMDRIPRRIDKGVDTYKVRKKKVEHINEENK